MIARDADAVPRSSTAGSLLIPAGARFDGLVQGGPPGRTLRRTRPGRPGEEFPGATLVTVVCGMTAVPEITPWLR